jgi:hypothetical protein
MANANKISEALDTGDKAQWHAPPRPNTNASVRSILT